MKNKKKEIKCPYCGSSAVLRNGDFVYGERSLGGKLLVCARYPKCNSYVSVHKDTNLPKGTLANGDLRNKRIQTHRVFDQIWKLGIMKKQDAYRWLQYRLGLNSAQTHIGNFSEYMCNQVIKESETLLKNRGVFKENEGGKTNGIKKKGTHIDYGEPKHSRIYCSA